MQQTNIGWTDFSGSTLKYRDPDGNVVNACIKASEGCRGCFAEALAPRWGRKGKLFTAENMKRLTPFFDEKEARSILTSSKISNKRFFLNDMTDWMGPWVSDEIIARTLAVIALRPDVTFQLLTKHADRLYEYFSQLSFEEIRHWMNAALDGSESAIKPNLTTIAHSTMKRLQRNGDKRGWRRVQLPLSNLHLGVSAETQKWFMERWGYLRRTPAAVRFLSLEPLLGRIDPQSETWEDLGRFIWPDWVIIGGETGSGYRTIPIEDVTATIHNFQQISRVFVKQDSGPRPGKQGRIPNEYWVHQFPAVS